MGQGRPVGLGKRRRFWSLGRRVPAGLLDSGMASIATFAVGVYAVRSFDSSELGAYALVFSAFLMAAVVPKSLVFVPARVRLLALPPQDRAAASVLTLPAGARVAMVASLLVALSLIGAGLADLVSFAVPLVVTAIVTAWLSPLQDHVRGLMHLARKSWSAAIVSTLQMTTVGLTLLLSHRGGVDARWTVFGALAVANAVSLIAAIALARSRKVEFDQEPFTVRELIGSGKWFLSINLVTGLVDFLGKTLVTVLATAAVLGVAEGARVAARPLAVFLLGVSAVMIPGSLEAGHDGDSEKARRVWRLYALGSLVVTAVYGGLGGFDWSFNPMVSLVPTGYTVPGLVAAMIAATALKSLIFPLKGEMTGAGREREMAAIELVAGVMYLLSCFLVLIIGAFVIPLAIATQAVARWVGYRVVLPRHYRGDITPVLSTNGPRTAEYPPQDPSIK